MSIADADAKAAMPAGDTAPEVGSKLKANMSQPIRKGVAKWTDTVRKMAVRSPREPAPCAHTRGDAWLHPALAHAAARRLVSGSSMLMLLSASA